MKTVIVEIPPPNNDLKFPCLMEHRGLIVLMVDVHRDLGIGMVVNDSKMARLGEYGEDWAMHNFKVFQGTLKLSND